MNNWFVDYIDWEDPKPQPRTRLSRKWVPGLREDDADLEPGTVMTELVEWANEKLAGEVSTWADLETTVRGSCLQLEEGNFSINACIGQFDNNFGPFMKRKFVRVLASYKVPKDQPKDEPVDEHEVKYTGEPE